MHFSWAAAAAVVVLGGSAQAGRAVDPGDPPGDVTVGSGLICNTSQQVERYVTLRAGGSEIQNALQLVNREARDPRACGLAAVAYHRDRTVETKSLDGKVVAIVRISVLAGYDGQQWAPVSPRVQYAVVETEGYAI